jgi:hypothetical protein
MDGEVGFGLLLAVGAGLKADDKEEQARRIASTHNTQYYNRKEECLKGLPLLCLL